MASAIGLPVKFLHYLLMFMLSLTIVASLQTVGIVLVVAMLITPGTTAFLLVNRLSRMMILATVFGVLSALSGLYLSFYLNVASGPTMVLVATFFFLLTMFISPKKGIIPRWIQRRRASLTSIFEDYLKSIYYLQKDTGSVSLSLLSEKLNIPSSSVVKILSKLESMGLVQQANSQQVHLTPEGRERALRVVRSHRLWELYLAEEAGLGWDKVHDEAERLEHILTDKIPEQLEKILGEPKVDPHGHPIPTKDGKVLEPRGIPLANMQPGQSGVITWVKDEDPNILKYLAAMGMFPRTKVTLKGRNTSNEKLIVQVDQYEYTITLPVAKSVYITPILED
jgi:Mn-dependent DtxR family transcriptional regulator